MITKIPQRQRSSSTSGTTSSRQASPPVTAANTVPELTTAERERLKECEQTFARHEKAIFEVGRALAIVRDENLYRAHGTFEDYCKKIWGYSRGWAYRQIDCVRAHDNLLTVVNTENLPPPTHERQLRPIIGLEPEVQRRVWKKASEFAGDKKVTGAHVGKATREIVASPPKGLKPTVKPRSKNNEDFDRMSDAEPTRLLLSSCNRAAVALTALHEVLDYGPVVGEEGHAAMKQVQSHYRAVASLAINLGILKE